MDDGKPAPPPSRDGGAAGAQSVQRQQADPQLTIPLIFARIPACREGGGLRSSDRLAGSGRSGPSRAPQSALAAALSGFRTLKSRLLKAVASAGRRATAGELILLTFAAPAAKLNAKREAKAVQETKALMAAAAAAAAEAADATSAEATSAAAGGVSGDVQQREQLELIASCDGVTVSP